MAEKISFPACYDPASGQKGEILGTLGITLLPPEGSGRDTVVRAEMPVDDRTAQCYGYLSGSAMLAVEEALAGFGSTRLVPDGYKPVGTSVTANHVHAVPYGESVTLRLTASISAEQPTSGTWKCVTGRAGSSPRRASST